MFTLSSEIVWQVRITHPPTCTSSHCWSSSTNKRMFWNDRKWLTTAAGIYFLHTCVQPGIGAYRASYIIGTRAMSMDYKSTMKLTTNISVEPRLKMHGLASSVIRYSINSTHANTSFSRHKIGAHTYSCTVFKAELILENLIGQDTQTHTHTHTQTHNFPFFLIVTKLHNSQLRDQKNTQNINDQKIYWHNTTTGTVP